MKRNPVAKFARRVNKATVQRDRTKYHRKEKHKGDDREDRRRPFSWIIPATRAAGPVLHQRSHRCGLAGKTGTLKPGTA